jgi:hypothetical protein
MRKRGKGQDKPKHVPPGHPEHPAQREPELPPVEEHPVMPEASTLPPPEAPKAQEERKWWHFLRDLFK